MEVPNTKFEGNPLGSSRVEGRTDGPTDRQTNIRKVKGAFGAYGKMHGNDL